jgi:hypothetical protein
MCGLIGDSAAAGFKLLLFNHMKLFMFKGWTFLGEFRKWL